MIVSTSPSNSQTADEEFVEESSGTVMPKASSAPTAADFYASVVVPPSTKPLPTPQELQQPELSTALYGVPNPRIFIGNCPSEKVTKAQIEQIFGKYGKILEVALKASYGFVQFENIEQASAAVIGEQSLVLGDVRVDLKFSKDRAARAAATTRPPAPPEHGRRDSRDSREADYRRDDYSRRDHDDRDYDRDYFRRRDDDDRRRRSDRSYSPHSRSSRRRSRSPSPRSSRSQHRPTRGVQIYDLEQSSLLEEFHNAMLKCLTADAAGHKKQDNLTLPAKSGPMVPEVIIICFSVDKVYVKEVEASVRDAGFTIENVYLSQRFNVRAVVRQRHAEGVACVIYLDRQCQRSTSLSLQTFYGQKITDYTSIYIDEALSIMTKEREIERSMPKYLNQLPGQQLSLPPNLSSLFPNNLGNPDLMALVGAIQQQQLQQQQQQKMAQFMPGLSAHQYNLVPQQNGAYQQSAPAHQSSAATGIGLQDNVGDILSRLKSLSNGIPQQQGFPMPQQQAYMGYPPQQQLHQQQQGQGQHFQPIQRQAYNPMAPGGAPANGAPDLMSLLQSLNKKI